MSNPVFPHSDLQDSAQFRVSLEDPTIRSKAEDGKEMTRYRHTRTPRKTFMSGFTYVNDTVRQNIDDFWETVHGGSLIFDWTNPENDTVYQVRFMEPIEFKYVGVGDLKRWDIAFKVRQA